MKISWKGLIFFTTTLILSFAPVSAKSDLAKEGIKGLVQRINISYSVYLEIFGETKNINISKEVKDYNKKGNETSITEYYFGFIPAKKIALKYNDLGLLQEEKRGVLFQERMEYFYNSDGKMSKAMKYDMFGKVIHTCTLLYSKNLEEIGRIYCKPNGETNKINVYTYDRAGLLIESIEYNKNMEIEEKETRKRDLQGHTTEKVLEGRKNKDTTLYKYDNSGRLIESVMYDSKGIPKFYFNYTYGDDGNLKGIYRFRGSDKGLDGLRMQTYEYYK